MKHQNALMEAGIGFLILGDLEIAAERLAMGLKGRHRKLVLRLCTYGFPTDIVEWASHNENNFDSEKQILSIMRSFSERKKRDELIVFFTGLYFVSNPVKCADFAENFLTYIGSIGTDSYGGLLAAIRRAKYPNLSFDPSENFQSAGGRFVKERILHCFEGSLRPSPAPFPEGNAIGDFFGQGLDLQLHSPDDLKFLEYAPVGALIHSIRHIINGHYSTAQALLDPIVQTTSEEFLYLAERTGPKKVFIGGYGWSGSGVIYDILRGYAQVQPMFGARAAPFLNDDADVEPMIHQGPAGMLDLLGMYSKRPRARKNVLTKFLRLYILIGPHHNYFEYKTVNCNQNLITELGMEKYYQLVATFMFELAGGLDQGSGADCDAAVSNFEHRIYNSLFPDERFCVLFNNSVNTQNVHLLANIKGRCHFIGVDRNFADQYLDQKGENQFFTDSPLKFFVRKALRLRRFHKGVRSLISEGCRFIYSDLKIDIVFFEEMVTDRKVVADICGAILGEYDEVKAYQNFDPSISIRNIKKSQEALTLWERAQVSIFSFMLARLPNRFTASRSK